MSTTMRSLMVGSVVLGTLVACGSSTKPAASPLPATTSPASTAAQKATTTTAAAAAGASSSVAAGVGASTTAGSADKVSANSASVPELEAAFEAAGVTNAQRWAQEVDEYRPYPDDPKWAKLRHELGKYNIAPEVLDKILSLLVL
jgi:hypothetical protein